MRKAGNRLRVTVQLVKAADGETVWAEHYDRELADVFAIQDEITENIAATIGGRLAAGGSPAGFARPPHAPDGLRLRLARPSALPPDLARPPMREACPLLEKAIELDPDNPRAHVLLGDDP